MKKQTFSSITAFRNCRRFFQNRYVRAIESIHKQDTLRFGTMGHTGLEMYYNEEGLEKIRQAIFDAAREAAWQGKEQRQELYAWAMISGYAMHFPLKDEPWEVVEAEPGFETKLINPATGRSARSFTMAGKVDLLVQNKETGEYAIMEHKTTTRPVDSFLQRIWTDFQIHLYAHYLGQARGIKIEKVIYNILTKSKLRRGGLSSKKQVALESDGDLLARLLEDHMGSDKLYHREEIIISDHRVGQLVDEVWEVKDQMLIAARRDKYYQNPSYCFHWNRPCEYYELCKSDDSEVIMNSYYQPRIPHEELTR
jgi:hypothetical protein